MSTLHERYLEPGDFHFGAAPLRLKTLLGSCVTVTYWHPRLHLGGMCHIQLPRRRLRPADGELDGHYADDAFLMFDQALARHGTHAHDYVVKLFGGGNMFSSGPARALDVGGKNLAAVRVELARRSLEPVTEHVGGSGHRKLVFDLASGHVWLAFSNLVPRKEAASG